MNIEEKIRTQIHSASLKNKWLKPVLIGFIALALIIGTVGFKYVKAEQSGSSPESGITSYIKHTTFYSMY